MAKQLIRVEYVGPWSFEYYGDYTRVIDTRTNLRVATVYEESILNMFRGSCE